MSKNILEELKQDEGFNGFVYKCSEGFDTIGYGTMLPIDKHEAELLLHNRLKNKIKALEEAEPFVLELPMSVRDVIYNMTYQLGVGGILKFRKMWAALKVKNYNEAARQGLDSLWAKQTPNRAKRLMEKLARG